jgi:hypothetical protein
MDTDLPTPTGSLFYLTTIVCYFTLIFRRQCGLSLRCSAFNTMNEQAGSSSQYSSDKIMALHKESYPGQQLSSRMFITLTLIVLLFPPVRSAFVNNCNNFLINLRISVGLIFEINSTKFYFQLNCHLTKMQGNTGYR